ncbi:DNA gyrase subunit A [Tuwongella immobilis]|uniref:DNA topoisomerase (ATP-hydrolyzing) n=1 Tax=Tuwongella immobilis TaxID=692036 RepID=A0A6C2YTG4_9BACT|nr:DNA gyrase subunit A [Tuwongella immobilis]VIP04205.1 dna gyrase subunit a : DNA gyrase subunit A OS=Rhodopirellula sp. SWK7 GN=gyrA PE=3 SV=1: DNA_topoisoIV: DNA_gyraseA_C: DNA_gyraseA_C: DNA_gyraseA_C: DNA_gyraseA_C: DNA_gyraseA_C: DNA_gyraseA_C [Tuwongella immobilis]VTS05774.1 dna gyrase subunit a : DNA gyrase subunit A OS=Rhodopirellula sp. SWK7 GN=gyrA PE=3 SV=1: DNA_topoisoIV: DNA_gyraseA_C: DNA_gyraseA_C: DNA_gyraseA_C: DNA_gyraseA_C: DNA_gyraseA_C: DNA_gyraseA_C [Tuwongella immobilis]
MPEEPPSSNGNPPPPETPPNLGEGLSPLPQLNIEDELSSSYLTYAMSVIISRALPDVRDGLKPSQRRILVAMNDLGLVPGGSTSKCSGIIGETMKRYHPHGDNSIYDSLTRMAQAWVLRYPLITGQGNFGSIAGLPAAAHRYTEAKHSAIAGEMLQDIECDTVDFLDNYDGKYQEPLVLPSKVPTLLINGSDGIAVGMATEIPPHNLREICDGLIYLLDHPEASLGEILRIIPGPDFPTGGIIRGRQGIVDGYREGRGKITLRARATIVTEGRNSQIVINEVPFQHTRNRLAESIADLVKNERIKGIAAMRDESAARNGEPVRLVIDLKRDADPNLVLNQLYQYSPLEKTVSIILLALVDGRPRVLSIKQMMQEFLRHRLSVIRRRTEFFLREAKRRGHVLEGQLIAISSLDEVINICRRSPNRAEAKVKLQQMSVAASVLERALGAEPFAALQRELGVSNEYFMTEQQADAVVRLQLGQLAALERDEIFREYSQLRENIIGWESLIADESKIRDVIKEDLAYLRDKYGDNRRTEISDEGGRIRDEDLIPEEEVVVSLTHNGYIKRVGMDTYRAQHRGGKGVSGGLHDDDFVEHFFVASTHAFLLCFTNQGQVYWLKVYDIPLVGRTSAGRALANVLSLKPEEKISSIIPVRRFEEGYELLMATKRGWAKKTKLADYSRPKQGGIIGIALDEGDTLIDVVLVKGNDEVVLSTRTGMAIRFKQTDVRSVGRNSRGVKGIDLSEGDELIGMVVADPEGYLLTVCENGYGKRTPFGPNESGAGLAEGGDALEESSETATAAPEPAEPTADVGDDADGGESADGGEGGESRSSMRYRLQRRGGKGVRDIRTSERNGMVVRITAVRDTDDVMLITAQGMVNRTHVDEIRIVGRNTQGVRIMNLNKDDRIASLAKVAREETEEVPATALTPDQPTPVTPGE